MDVHTWIENDLQSIRGKLDDSVLSVIPRQRWVEQADDGGSSIAHLLLHVARHQDLAVATAIRDHAPLFVAHRDALGLADAEPFAGLPEREDRALTTSLPLDALVAYVEAVFEATTKWLGRVDTAFLDTFSAARKGTPATESMTRDRAVMGFGLERIVDKAGGGLIRIEAGTADYAFERVLRETAAYYLLGVTPDDNDRDGKPHYLRVNVKGRGLTVRSRKQVLIPRR